MAAGECGMGGNDTLVGNSTSEDTFGFGSGSGRDTIENFGEEDTLWFLNGNFSGATVGEDGHLRLKWSDNQGNDATLILDEDVRDEVITYNMGDGSHGAKFGDRLTITDNTADFVNYYNSGGSKGELVLSGKENKSIWLDGSQGVGYDGFRRIDAQSMEGSSLTAWAVFVPWHQL